MNFYVSIYFISILLLFKISSKRSTILNVNYYYFLLFILNIGSFYSYLNGRVNTKLYSLNPYCSINIYDNNNSTNYGNSTIKLSSKNKISLDSLSKIFDNDARERLTFCLNFTNPCYNYHIGIPHPSQPWTLFRKWNFTLEDLPIDQFIKSALMIYDHDECILEDLSKYDPNWKSKFYIAGSFEQAVGENSVNILVFFPNFVAENKIQ